MTWDANHYLRFGDERTRPAADLAARIAVESPARVIDLGCGPGNSTRVLAERWPSARLTGLDSSQEMLDVARESGVDARWLLGDAGDWTAETPFDVVFSNAALQWVRDHGSLMRCLFDQVSVGGVLAFQVPSERYATVRALIAEVADDPAWRERMAGPRRALTMHPIEFYYDSLAEKAKRLDIWETEYDHILESPEAIVEWMSSTGLRPYLDALDTAEERERFSEMLTKLVVGAYPRRVDGKVLFGFRRMFVIAYR
jgi:trans-aconitate 2-methyltransferase